tara:strand:+ start:4460 stop:4855 length:396 start_codon:yes stop_codon:yes gene_type:complete
MSNSLTKNKDLILSNFKCQNSGNCCRSDGFVYLNQIELETMAKELNISIELFKSQFTKIINGWTVIASPHFRQNCFLNPSNRCMVYQSRPNACQSYPNWASIWESETALILETTRCPGLKKAVDLFKSTEP